MFGFGTVGGMQVIDLALFAIAIAACAAFLFATRGWSDDDLERALPLVNRDNGEGDGDGR